MQRQLGLRQAQLRRGGDSGGAGTIAAVYAAGAASPLTADLMAMVHGNLRFGNPVDSNSLPILGYFEDVSGESTAASGFPSELWSLAIAIGGGAFGRRFALYQMFDPTWNGSLAGINGLSWETERISFTNDPTNEYQNQNVNPAFGNRMWKAFNNTASAGYPQGSAAQGMVGHLTGLFNTIDNGLRFVDQLDGWGQTNRELTPLSNGITWQWASHWNSVNLAGAAGDGIGWGIYAGDLGHFNHPQAGLVARQVTGNAQGDWYWSFLVPDGSGGLLDVADFAKSGVTFNAPTTFNGTPSTADPIVAYRSALIDLTTIADNIPIAVPQRPGFIFCGRSTSLYVRDSAGTATTGLTVTIGNNASHDNISPGNAISAASINGLTAHLPSYFALASGGTLALVDSGTAIVAKISAVPAGMTSLHGYFVTQGFWVPV